MQNKYINNKIAILLPGNGEYFISSKKVNGKVHPFRRKIYESVNKLGYVCEYIGYGDLSLQGLKQYSALFLLNIKQLAPSQKQCLNSYLKNGGNLLLTYKTILADEFGISFIGKSCQRSISFQERKTRYQTINVSNIIYKINHRYFKSILPIETLLKLPVIKVRAEDKNETLATWGKAGLPALLINRSYTGTVAYFSGILAGAENSLLKYILSLMINLENFKALPAIPNSKKCCVTIFHDYEREYGHPKLGKYADIGLNSILESEKKHNIKTTFNIVGKICESHPETIKQIIQDGHEIASHTYNHEVPSHTNYKRLDNSLDLNLKAFKAEFDIELNRGFRSPESKWSPDLIKLLEKRNFLWNAEGEEASLPYNLVVGRKLRLMRMPVTCDDYSYISKNASTADLLKKLKEIIETGIKEKSFVAIGFHPWIEGMKKERLVAFEDFLSYLSSKNDVAVMTFSQAHNWWNDRNKGCTK